MDTVIQKINGCRCETLGDLIDALHAMCADPAMPVSMDTPIRQGFGDGFAVTMRKYTTDCGDDVSVSIEEFDFNPDAESKKKLVRAKCQHCPRHMQLLPNDFRSDSVLVQCGGCGKCTWIDTPEHLRKGDGYRVGDRHEWNASEHDTGD